MPSHPRSSSRSRSSSSTSSPSTSRLAPSKRTRIERACRSCVASKTRCEDISPTLGCLRCRSRQRHCSFLEVPSPRETNPGLQLPQEVIAKLDMLAGLISRVEHLEHSSSTAGPPSISISTPASALVGMPLDSSSMQNRIHDDHVWALERPSSFDERMFSTAVDSGYPDTVSLGLVSFEQVDLAFQMFKHRFALMLPLHPLTLASTTVPNHPFLILAILVHVPTLAPASSQLDALINQSVIHALSGAISTHVILALLILSLAPLPHLPQMRDNDDRDTIVTAHLTSLRIIGMAYEMGLGIGLEDRTKAAVSRSDNWGEPWFAERVQEALLWETVKSRYIILTLMHARASPSLLPPSNVRHLSSVRCSDSVGATIEHLIAEADLIDTVRDTIGFVAALEAEGVDSVPHDLSVAESTWREVFDNLESFKANVPSNSGNIVLYDAHVMAFALVIRISSFYQLLPFAIHPSLKRPGLYIAGVLFLKLSASLIDFIASIPTSSILLLPANIVITLGLVVLCSRRTIAYVREHHPDIEDLPLDEEKVACAYEQLAANPTLATIMKVVLASESRRETAKRQNPDSAAACVGAVEQAEFRREMMTMGDVGSMWEGMGVLPDDWLDLDMTAWSATLGWNTGA